MKKKKLSAGKLLLMLSRLRRFLVRVMRSCYDMELYREVRMLSWKAALKYLLAYLAILISLLFVIVLPFALRFPHVVNDRIALTIPEGASFELKDGHLSSSVTMPVDLGTELFPVTLDTTVIDSAHISNEVPDVGFLIGDTRLFFVQDGQVMELFSYEDMTDSVYMKDDIILLVQTQGAHVVFIALVAAAIAHFGFLIINTLLFVMLMSAMAQLVANLWRVKLDYKQWVAVGFYAVTLPILVDHTFWVFGVRTALLFPILFFMYIVGVIIDEKNQPTGILKIKTEESSGKE